MQETAKVRGLHGSYIARLNLRRVNNAIAGGDWTQKGIVFAALLVIMGLNLATLLNIEVILKHGSPLVQRVLGWVLALLQAALAAQYIINGLVRLGALPTLVS